VKEVGLGEFDLTMSSTAPHGNISTKACSVNTSTNRIQEAESTKWLEGAKSGEDKKTTDKTITRRKLERQITDGKITP
jgi:hypothetical protein